MKYIFIAQPMNGKTEDEIIEARKVAIQRVKALFDEDICILNSYFKNLPRPMISSKSIPLFYLAKSLELLSSADAAYFMDGWRSARGCRIEYTCAKDYGIKILGDINNEQ